MSELISECDRSMNGYCVTLPGLTCDGLKIGMSCKYFVNKNLPSNPCDWNPKEGKPSEYITGCYGPTNGCQNEATWRVGSIKVWHLSNECAKLPEFKKYRSRVMLKEIEK